MFQEQNPDGNAPAPASDNFRLNPPQLALPKGGGAIRSMGEKFSVNAVTGTAALTVPISLSPGRSGFGPELSLSYDSGSGNGPFGFGWQLGLPTIRRKTDKGLPRYNDARESDVFLLSGAEDLVPVLKVDAHGELVLDGAGRPQFDELQNQNGYQVHRYRPRIEGLFARIERWTRIADGDTYWRTISRDNVTTIFGASLDSRIADPADARKVFAWNISLTYDDKGNAAIYDYVKENAANLDPTLANERNRSHTANRYLKRIRYGNVVSRLVDPNLTDAKRQWLFEAVLDYGEHDLTNPTPDPVPNQDWPCRRDSFSTYRPGFEVRTHRLCQRVLMFHRFVELGAAPRLVRSTDFRYLDATDLQTDPQRGGLLASFLRNVHWRGYQALEKDYLVRSMPPLEFKYSPATIDLTVREVAPDSVENLPAGLDGQAYQWVDLDRQGVPGILSEQASGWFFKRNLSPIRHAVENGVERSRASFAPLQPVRERPSAAMLTQRAQFMDLSGDGQADLVLLDGPTPGFFRPEGEAGWGGFRAFEGRPNRDLRDPNLRFVDLDGDGLADVLITENEALTWYSSLGEWGFGAANRVAKSIDEERGPAVVFDDGTQTVYLADMSGDGLNDLVRIRADSIVYWPNMGYGCFGPKVTMDNPPWLDAVDHFDPRRLHLADIDGSGTADLIYLGDDAARVCFNQSGNRWSDAQALTTFPRINGIASVATVDLLGNGTSCLVWSSAEPGATRAPLRYLDLMSGRKPHLLIEARDNLGAVTAIEYQPSTRFFLEDKAAGRSWVTHLPFPVQCVSRVTVTDQWRNCSFSTSYSYHHGYFDGAEREFRGFGRVEQIDQARFGKAPDPNSGSPYVTSDQTLWQPPVKTVTWFHTGAYLRRDRILSHYREEYFPNWFEASQPGVLQGGFHEHTFTQPDLESLGLTAEEWREALRACKGMMLRQEVYELPAAAGGGGKLNPVKLFSATENTCHIRRVQPRGRNRHAVFLVTPSEGISYHYELDLRGSVLEPDPRIAHNLVLQYDAYGRATQEVNAVYPRVGSHEDDTLSQDQLGHIHDVQSEQHVAYAETRFTAALPDDIDNYRLPLPYDVITCELTSFTAAADGYFVLGSFRAYALSDTLPNQGALAVAPVAYQDRAADGVASSRTVERTLSLFFKEDLSGPMPLGQANRLGLKFESYKCALTDSLLTAVLGQRFDGATRAALGENAALAAFLPSGYQTDTALFATGAAAKQWWMRSGIAGFADGADSRFYLPDRYSDPFGNVTTLTYDGQAAAADRRYLLFVQSSTDALGNTQSVDQFDYRVLAPATLRDANDNLSAALYDALGFPVVTAQLGKVAADGSTESGDTLLGFAVTDLDPALPALLAFFAAPVFDDQQARKWVGKATTRFVYFFGGTLDAQNKPVWGVRPAGIMSLRREKHEGDAANVDTADPAQQIPLQISVEYSDGGGNVLVKKVQAEPDPTVRGAPVRWIANGKTVVNNKGKPVKQHEPYWSATLHRFDAAEAQVEVGGATVTYYDAVGRVVRQDTPDGAFSRAEFSPWFARQYDANDTVLDSTWYADRSSPGALTAEPTDPDQRAAWLATVHSNTPAEAHTDSLGRTVISIVQNRVADPHGPLTFAGRQWRDEKYLSFTKLDAEGKALWVRDVLGNLVMQYITPLKPTRWADDPTEDLPAKAVTGYDIAGNLLFQHSMDGGDRYLLTGGAAEPMLSWDRNERKVGGNTASEDRRYVVTYDALHRPLSRTLALNGGAPLTLERLEYSNARHADGSANAQLAADKAANLLGQLVRRYDGSGLAATIRRDFRGNVLEAQRRLNNQPTQSLIDWSGDPQALLSAETFQHLGEFDALSRPVRSYNWRRINLTRVAVVESKYNQRGLLSSQQLLVRAEKTAAGYAVIGETTTTNAIGDIHYNIKGQMEYVSLGNGTLTQYDYDPQMFRLIQVRTTRPPNAGNFPTARAMLSELGVVQQLLYSYDAVGNITEINDQAFEPVFFQNQQVGARSRYEYDALYRLTLGSGRENGALRGAPVNLDAAAVSPGFPVAATDPNALRNYTQIFTYDAGGNIRELQHQAGSLGSWTRDYSYALDDPTQPASNRLWQTWTGGDKTTAITYAHDTHGNLLNLANTAPNFTVAWDPADMIAGLNLGGGGQAYYQYAASKQRSRKQIVRNGVSIEERIYIDGFELFRRTSAGRTVEEIESHHLMLGDKRVLLVDDVLTAADAKHPRSDGLTVKAQTLLRYQYSNNLNSAGLELDGNAAIISYEEFHPYGTSAYRAVDSALEAAPKRYRFTGMERDEESGLNYHTARYYAPWLARWTSSDPSGLKDGPNRYAAMHNSPIVLKDLGGRAVQPGLPGGPVEIPGGPSYEPIEWPWGEPIGRPAPPTEPIVSEPPVVEPLPSPPLTPTAPVAPPASVGAPLAIITEGLGAFALLVIWPFYVALLVKGTESKYRKLAQDLNRGAGKEDRSLPGAPSSGPLSTPAQYQSTEIIGDRPSSVQELRKAPGQDTQRKVEFPAKEIRGDLKLASARSAELESIRVSLENLAQDVIGIAIAEKTPGTFGRLGTEAHGQLEDLVNDFNEKLAAKGSRFRLRAEQFFDIKGNPTSRKAPGSLGVDILITYDDLPIEAADLKTGRGFSQWKADEVERRIGVPLFEVGPQVAPYATPGCLPHTFGP
jgi:RHS repeat-associated protein